MSELLLDTLTKQSEQLNPDELLILATRLIDLARHAPPAPPPVKRHWREIRGVLQVPAVGEDAQAWVSRARQEDDTRRAQSLQGSA